MRIKYGKCIVVFDGYTDGPTVKDMDSKEGLIREEGKLIMLMFTVKEAQNSKEGHMSFKQEKQTAPHLHVK